MIKKATLTIGITFLFVALAFQASALTPPTDSLQVQEATIVEKFMNKVEQIATESTSLSEFYEKLQTLCNGPNFSRFPILQEIMNKLYCFINCDRGYFTKDTPIGDLLDRMMDRIPLSARPDYLVISYGVYHRLNPLKHNTITRFKQGLSMWRYSDTSILIKGRTLVLERKPFGIHQKMTGPQVGLMSGFKGIYIDHESKLTGDSYVFFIGHAHRIRVFDLTPFSK
jgi:hypothetical protein